MVDLAGDRDCLPSLLAADPSNRVDHLILVCYRTRKFDIELMEIDLLDPLTETAEDDRPVATEAHQVAFDVLNEIGILNQLSSNMLASVLPKGMTQAQFTILNHYVRLGIDYASPADLARAFQVTRPTITSTLSRLERAGLVAIGPEPDDGRGKRVSLTPAGRSMRDVCLKRILSLMPLIEGMLDPEGFAALLPGLRRLRIGLDGARD
jgi:DNA-binding MarR family transcriptional regulator